MKPVVFFDMDGTLLNMGESAFEKEYLQRMLFFFERKFPGKGNDVMKAMGYAAEKMKHNDGLQSNEVLFWQAFEKASGQTREAFEPQFLQYYTTDYAHIGDDYVPDADMKALVHLLDEKGYQLVVATNPLVPQIANQQRVRWAGVDDVNWLEITSFEHYSSCKPNAQFYQEICQRLQLNPTDCIMIGNSITDDGTAQEIGMDFYLLLGENPGNDAATYTGKKGSRGALLELVKGLPVRTC